MTIKLKIGARGSPLSLAQTGLVAAELEAANPGLTTEIIAIKTTGDRILDAPLAKIGGKGLFVKEIEEALLEGRIDMAVHSAKDMPSELPDGLCLAATPRRADFRDVLITRQPGGLESLPKGAKVGTSGLRRQAQLLALRPDLVIGPMRGNVATRLARLETECEATLLAAAGLNRLAVSPPNAVPLDTDIMLPAAGQGSLALEARCDDEQTLAVLAKINHYPTLMELSAERGFLGRLGSGCQLPVAALASFEGGHLTLTGLIASLDGQRLVKDSLNGTPEDLAAAEALGRKLAAALLEAGGEEIMKEVLV